MPVTLERIWLTWIAVVLLLALAVPGGGDALHDPGLTLRCVLPVALVQAALLLLSRRLTVPARRLLRSLAAMAGLPLCFSSLGGLLPAVHPAAREWDWLALDRAVFGGDPTVWLQRWLQPWSTDLLQAVYAGFYVVPISAALLVLWQRGRLAFDRCTVVLVFGFLASYLGYLLWPTLGPSFFLDHGRPLQGWFWAERLHAAIDAAEANRWDCFPSGHTMMSVTSLLLVVRFAPRFRWPFAALVAAVVFSTMALRYHWVADVVAGALLAAPAMWLAEFLFELDGGQPA